MELTVQLHGFAELVAGLRELPDKVSRTILSKAVSAGALVVQQQMKQNAEGMRDTGTLARSIYRKYIRELSGPETKVFFVAPRQGKQYQKMGKKKNVSKDAYYARFVEFGHFTRPPGTHLNKRGLVRANKIGRNSNRGGVDNAALADQVQSGAVKWVPAQPFMRPAFDAKKEAAIDAMRQVLAAGITQAAKLGLRK